MGYLPVFVKQKTSLKKECKNGNCLASEYDNIWYNTSKVSVMGSQAIHFYKDFPSLEHAKKISDHIPIAVEIVLK